jgi:glycosyltransferase involved in cell wall biosynthesis
MARSKAAPGPSPRVFYGRDHVPAIDEPAHGGTIKFQGLQHAFPNASRDFNVLYLGSSTVPPDSGMLVRLARRRRASIVWNQNGVAYPGWFGPAYQHANRPLARVLHEADHVFFQSEFCRLSSDRFLGRREGPSEVLYNPVDTTRFTPAPAPPDGLVILLGGNQYQRYRFESAVRALAEVVKHRDDARLIVAGALSWSHAPGVASREADALIAELGLEGRVDLAGTYTQAAAPALMQSSDLLLHTKYNDPCPTVVLEAMASGLPVVYSASGGVPELVGDEAGIGIPAPLDFERDHPANPSELATAVLDVAARLPELSDAARRRAVERFDLEPWIARHREVFEELRR